MTDALKRQVLLSFIWGGGEHVSGSSGKAIEMATGTSTEAIVERALLASREKAEDPARLKIKKCFTQRHFARPEQ